LVEANKKFQTNLHYLTPYIPIMSPIKRLRKVMNEYGGNNKYSVVPKELRQKIIYFTKLYQELALRCLAELEIIFKY